MLSTKSTLVVNIDATFSPRSASPRQTLACIFSFAELYTYQWQGWITRLPMIMQAKARTALAMVYLPKVLALYLSPTLNESIDKLKLGRISQSDFFNTLLTTYFPFLNTATDLDTTPIELVENAWINPRIQALTTREQKRFQQALIDFEKIILIGNANAPDIKAFIMNLLQSPELQAKFTNAPSILAELEDYRGPDRISLKADELLNLAWNLGSNVSILASPQAKEWKVQTGTLAKKTGSAGFLSKLLEAIPGNIVVMSEAPTDLRRARQLDPSKITVTTSNAYFKDTSWAQQSMMNIHDNWPPIIILIIAIALLYYFLLT